MGELGNRFGELMARMAQGDAERFPAVGQQNVAIRELLEAVTAAPAEMAPAAAVTPPGRRRRAASLQRATTTRSRPAALAA